MLLVPRTSLVEKAVSKSESEQACGRRVVMKAGSEGGMWLSNVERVWHVLTDSKGGNGRMWW